MQRESDCMNIPPMHSAELRAWQGPRGSALPVAAACLGIWSCRVSSEQRGPAPSLVSPWAGACVVSRGWAGAGLPPVSLVDRCQLAASTALTMYPSLATYPWLWTIPMACSMSGMIPPSTGGPCQEGWCRKVWGAFIVQKQQAFALTRSGLSPSLLFSLLLFPSLRHSLEWG